jgi:outer membrane receptor for ferrienterochelin and colicin
LKPEKGLGMTAVFEQWLLNDAINLTAGYFLNVIEDMVLREETVEMYNGLPVRLYKNVSSAVTQGMELNGRVKLKSGFTGKTGYTLTATENKENGGELTYIPRHNFYCTPGYFWKKAGIGLNCTFNFNSRQYTNQANSESISGAMILDAKFFKDINNRARISVDVNDLFDSDEGRIGRYHMGRSLAMKLDVEF